MQGKQIDLESLLHFIHTINLRRILDLYVKVPMTALLEANIGEYLSELGADKDALGHKRHYITKGTITVKRKFIPFEAQFTRKWI